jgi:hypothetical protein
MSWIQTYTGRRFDPLDAAIEAVDIADIAHSLSLQCRFNGHCRAFYCVADHSLRVSEAVPPDLALWGLLHDAAEAYLGDLPRPIKQEASMFREAEDRLLEIIARRFGLSWPMPDPVRRADNALLATELRDLMGPPPEPWPLRAAPLPGRIVPLGPAEAEAAFLARYRGLSRGVQKS